MRSVCLKAGRIAFVAEAKYDLNLFHLLCVVSNISIKETGISDLNIRESCKMQL
jgi:hypothetical protein